uniref:CxC3 like cysteine cluster domain-containing protein n=1 Tax=Daphnia galeata TaxID=27404 RepID=A0A8J2RYQ8_9CRUS|nr:unnamed protein product [Daphnia galeata]
MSGRDLKLDSLARHKARTKAKKRKKDTSPKRSGNFFRNFGRGRGRGRVTQSDEVVAVSNQEGDSEITLSNERSGVQDIIHSVSLEQDIIEASILQLNKKKKEANQESQWKTRMKDKEDAWDSKRDAVFQNYISSRSYSCPFLYCLPALLPSFAGAFLSRMQKPSFVYYETWFKRRSRSYSQCQQLWSAMFEAKAEDYFASGFQPSSAVDETSFYLICTDLLDWCRHFQHKMPGISMNKIVETIQEISEQHNRCTSLSNTEFLMAIREYEFNRIRIQKEISRVEHMKCKACGAKPLACHVDGNMKCYRCGSAQGHGAKELLENVAIGRNDDVEAFVAEVNKAIPEGTLHVVVPHSKPENLILIPIQRTRSPSILKNGIEDLLLDNIQEDGDEENEAYEEDSEEETADYQDYSDEETNDYQDYADEGNEGNN